MSERLAIPSHHLAAALHEIFDPSELRQAESGLDVRQTIVVADLGMDIALARAHRMVAKKPRSLGKVMVAGSELPALAGSDYLVSVKGECADFAQRTDLAAFVECAVSLGGILDDNDAAAGTQLQDRIHIGGLPVKLNDNYRARAIGDGGRDAFGADAPAGLVRIGENRSRAGVQHGAGACDKCQGRHDHFVARADSQAGERQMQSGRAVAGADSLAGFAVSGEFAFESCYVLAERRHPSRSNRIKDVTLFELADFRLGDRIEPWASR